MPYPQISFEYVGFHNDSNSDGVLHNGESANVIIQIINSGTGPTEIANLTSIAIGENAEFLEIINSEIDLGIISTNQNIVENIIFQISENAPENMIFDLRFTFTDGIDEFEFEQSIGTDVLWISDAQWTFAETGWGDLNRDYSCDGNTISLNDVEYQKGIGVHANSEIIIDLNSNFSQFNTDIGVDDEVSNGAGSVEFQIFLDGIEFYNSGIMDSDSPTQSVNLNVTNVQELKLIVDESTFGISSDHADWAGAYLIPNMILGDINYDEVINILDVIETVNLVLSNEYEYIADINSDGIVNILDIIRLVNIILN